jgi:transposase InsO family protein
LLLRGSWCPRREVEGLWEAADAAATEVLVKALVDGDYDKIDAAVADGHRPLLLAISDNGPQMRSHTTREFLAGVAIARQFGRPGVPQDQGWIESLFGHVKGDWPHLEKIRDPGELAAELEQVQLEYNSVRLHASIGYVTPEDEHEGRGDAIREHRRRGLARAREARIAYRRNTTTEENR